MRLIRCDSDSINTVDIIDAIFTPDTVNPINSRILALSEVYCPCSWPWPRSRAWFWLWSSFCWSMSFPGSKMKCRTYPSLTCIILSRQRDAAYDDRACCQYWWCKTSLCMKVNLYFLKPFITLCGMYSVGHNWSQSDNYSVNNNNENI